MEKLSQEQKSHLNCCKVMGRKTTLFYQFKPLYDGKVKTFIMLPFDLHQEFYNQPIWLTEDEKLNPLAVIGNFFGDITLMEVRMQLANLCCRLNRDTKGGKRQLVLSSHRY